ncbi:hypothetical protein IFM12276_52940 [Nocardia sputorum]|uniref:Uncharacterized protein n=1 Tax=Nocardia sputorum TaxID=2984338 RepID=A0ABM8D4I0_9NOCA|nr:hypothetical protein IFM12276_52940 [Nocardia sputorum]
MEVGSGNGTGLGCSGSFAPEPPPHAVTANAPKQTTPINKRRIIVPSKHSGIRLPMTLRSATFRFTSGDGSHGE